MSEKWGISRVGKPELEVGDTPQEAIIRLQILPLPPLAWTDCFMQTVRRHGVTIIGTGIHPDKIEAVARPAEVEDVLGKIDSAIENANAYVERVVLPRRQADRDVTSAEADERQKLQAELDQLAESSPNLNTSKMRVPSESHLFRRAAGEGGPVVDNRLPKYGSPGNARRARRRKAITPGVRRGHHLQSVRQQEAKQDQLGVIPGGSVGLTCETYLLDR